LNFAFLSLLAQYFLDDLYAVNNILSKLQHMTPPKWFDRKFNFDLDNNEYSTIIQRLEKSPLTVLRIIAGVPETALFYQPGGKWSVKEHIGHLCTLEKLWQERIIDIQHNKPELVAADLENKATFEAGFNNWNISTLTRKFSDERDKTLRMLNFVAPEEKNKTSMHPRLKQPMRLIDIAYFAAEHDDHHLKAMHEIIEGSVNRI
jgi:hypothetical protein